LIIIATITKAKWHSARSDLPAVKAEITTERFPHTLLFAAADAILVSREPVSVGPRGRWIGAAVAELVTGEPPHSVFRIAQTGTNWAGRNTMVLARVEFFGEIAVA
jgi:hypothetical protein